MTLSLAQQFEQNRMLRTINATTDVETLQSLCRQLLSAWQNQRAATAWVMRQQLGAPSIQAWRKPAAELRSQEKGAPAEAPVSHQPEG